MSGKGGVKHLVKRKAITRIHMFLGGKESDWNCILTAGSELRVRLDRGPKLLAAKQQDVADFGERRVLIESHNPLALLACHSTDNTCNSISGDRAA